MFPSKTLADSEEGLAVPFWAAKDRAYYLHFLPLGFSTQGLLVAPAKVWSLQRFNITQAKAFADEGTTSMLGYAWSLIPILEGRSDFLPSGHVVGRDPSVVPVVSIVCGLTLAVLFGTGLYLLALLRQTERVYLERMS